MDRFSDKIRHLLVHMIEDDEDAQHLYGGMRGLRHFDALEQHALTPGACGYLLELSRRGEIPNGQRELIIHYASQLDGERLDRVDVEELVDHLLFAFSESELPARVFPESNPH